MLDLDRGIVAGGFADACRQGGCQLADAGVIQQMEGLRRYQRFGARQTVRIHHGQIKALQQRHQLFPQLLHIDAAPPARNNQTSAAYLHRLCRSSTLLHQLL